MFDRRIYTPLTWYWIAEDGRIFSSARQVIVPADDEGYVAFCTGGPASDWPRDDQGNQTDAALQQVFDMLGVKVGGETLKEPFVKVRSTSKAPTHKGR